MADHGIWNLCQPQNVAHFLVRQPKLSQFSLIFNQHLTVDFFRVLKTFHRFSFDCKSASLNYHSLHILHSLETLLNFLS